MQLDEIIETVHEALWADTSIAAQRGEADSLETNIRPLLGSIAAGVGGRGEPSLSLIHI